MNTLLYNQIKSLLEEEDSIATFANISACINESVDRINWVGFYFIKNNELVLGPFQGKVACTHIPLGKGVCGTAAQKKEALLVDDVHQFPGHIACDCASQSELVIPLCFEDTIYGVLDMDSPYPQRFSQEDLQTFCKISDLIARTIKEKNWF